MSARSVRRFGWNALGVAVFVVMVFPVFWMISTAFKTNDQINSLTPVWFPGHPTLQHFRDALARPYFWTDVKNSLIVVLITVGAAMALAFLAAVALAKYRFTGRKLFIVLMIGIQMLPSAGLIIPLYVVLARFHQVNRLSGVILVYLAAVLPFSVWTLRGFMIGIPKDLEEAAMVDGSTRLGAFVRILLPLVAPGLVATSVFAFITSWNEYIFARIILSDSSKQTITVWLSYFLGGSRFIDWGAVMAASTLIAIPVVIFFLLVQRRIAFGLTAGAVREDELVMTADATRAGCSYFGVRIPRHVRRDMADLASRGYTGVLHTFSENDLAYYRGTMAELVAASHAEGLVVQASPWGLGRTFGGEAESRWVAFHPGECQVLDDGRRVGAACLNSAAYRAFCKDWADWALDCGVDSVFWDEPAWVAPAHVGVGDPARWTCRCDRCADRFGASLPSELTAEVQSFREASVVDFLRELVGHVAARGGANTVCLLPAIAGTQGLSDWDEVAALPGLTTFATDPYWKHWGEPAGPFVRRFARLLRETADRHGVGAQLWVPSFGLGREDVPELEAAVQAAREEGVGDLWTWGYEACRQMTSLATPDASVVWEAVSAALTKQPQGRTEAARTDVGDLDLRSTRDLVRLLNEEDATVPAAVAEAGDGLAAAIDAIVERLRRGGRLVYTGAGSSGALAALDAAECSTTFGSPPGEVVAAVAERPADEDDRAAATNALLELSLRAEDCVVAVSASGSTPFVLAALEAARAAGALTVAVASARGTRAAALAEFEVAVPVGPEVIAGSTRLKAGTAQKLVLNTISTVTMIRLGRTYGGLMIGVAPGNEKLRARARRNVALASGASEERVDEVLTAAAGDARVALVSLLAGIDADAARARLEASGGSVRRAADQ